MSPLRHLRPVGTEIIMAEVDRPPYLFLSRDDDDDVRDIGKHGFRSVLLHPMLSNANQTILAFYQPRF